MGLLAAAAVNEAGNALVGMAAATGVVWSACTRFNIAMLQNVQGRVLKHSADKFTYWMVK